MSGPSQKKRPIPQRPGINEELGVKASWLIQTHSFFAAEDKVVRLYHTDERCRMSMLAFQRLFRSWFERREEERLRDVVLGAGPEAVEHRRRQDAPRHAVSSV